MELRGRRAISWAAVLLLGLGGLLWLRADVARAATTRYVATTGNDNAGTNDCTSQASPCLTIANAITHAANGDTIQIGPGIFATSVTSTGKALTFAGAGAGTASAFDATKDTAVDAIATQQSGFILGNHNTTIQDLRVRGGVLPDGNGGEVLPAVRANGTSGPTLTVTDAILLQGAPPSPDVIDYALDADTTKTVVENTIVAGYQDGITTHGTGGSLTLQNSSVLTPAPANPGLSALPVAALWASTPAAITDSRLTGIEGVYDQNAHVTVLRTLIGASGAGAAIQDTGGGPTLAVRDSLIDVVGNPVGSAAGAFVHSVANSEPTPPTLSLTGDTVFVRGDHTPAALNVSVASAGTTINVRNTILHAIDTSGHNGNDDILAGTNAINWNVGYTDYSEVAGQGVPAPGSTTNITAPPNFVNDSGSNLHLSASSTLFDKGDPTIVGAGETDVTGAPRSVPHVCGGAARPDLGAYEAATLPCPIAPPVPSLSHFAQSHKNWRTGSKAAAITAAKHHKHTKKAPVGTTFSFTLNTPAQVTLTFTGSAKGRKSKGKRGKCVAQTKRNQHNRACKRTIAAGTITFSNAATGTDSISFDGKIPGHRKLKPGRYSVTIEGSNSSGHSTTSTLHFTVVKR